ncbi:MAG: DUF1579 domain-containing protein [Kangiellaceae bacterium]|nr:DUF1579 domain-containing protein [Kangiellaceae bacterium]
MPTNSNHNQSKDFDFIIGNWLVKHQKLLNPLSNSQEWIMFEGNSSTNKILNGFGNLEDNVIHLPNQTYHAAAVRSYNSETNTWSIWWLDSRFPEIMGIPVVGTFKNRIGTFYANEIFKGKGIKVRFIWNATEPSVPKWEQAFSLDDGVTWETNWIMHFHKE